MVDFVIVTLPIIRVIKIAFSWDTNINVVTDRNYDLFFLHALPMVKCAEPKTQQIIKDSRNLGALVKAPIILYNRELGIQLCRELTLSRPTSPD